MSRHPFRSALRTGLSALILLALVGVQVAAARPEPGARRARRGFNLRAEPFTVFLVNRVACGINNLGEVCVDPGNSPIGGGGFWPKGTPNQYIFNTGLQVAGVIPGGAGFEWAGDTVGAYFMDPRGTQAQGDGVTLVYNSLDPSDAANWPTGAVVRDAAIYAPSLLGRNTISQQDLWVRAWDGNPTLLSGRTHPMGVLVETRGLAWNFPTGNEDILYFVYTITNVTASDPAAYAAIDPAIRNDVAALGAQFQDGVSSRLGVTLPPGGYTVDDVYVAFFADMDVGDAAHNFGTASLPFALGQTYKADFRELNWDFRNSSIFGPPFAAAPGFVGVKYLRSPVNPATGQEVGLTMFSNTLNSASGFPDPVGVIQLWRYLSGNASTNAGDNPCTIPPAEVKLRRLCYLSQVDIDVRFFQSSGPFSLAPGQQVTIVVAYVHAAPLAAFITPGSIAPNAPGIPPSGAELVTNPALVRRIDRAMGWVGQADSLDCSDPTVGCVVGQDNVITQNEVTTAPRSLLQKSLVAQAIYDNKFVLPFAPEPPRFFLVPGQNQVTVVWEPSVTVTLGDPFFSIASDPSSALFDPNFRSNDVEGYRIYRGRTTGDIELIAQFDYSGTTMRDYTAGFDYGSDCMPEATPPITGGCPVVFNGTNFNPVPVVSPFVQVPPGGRVELATGAVLTTVADSAVTGGGSGYPDLTDTGVPFAFVDRAVRSSFNYYYAVTAFDVNSVKSGPSSLESARIVKSVTPRAPAGNAVPAVTVSSIAGDDGQALDLNAPFPTIDPANGTFSGNLPPVRGGSFGFLASVAEALPAGDIAVTIDSVGPGFAGGFGPDPQIYVTLSAGNVTLKASAAMHSPTFNAGAANDFELSTPLVPYDSVNARRLGLEFNDTSVRMPVRFGGRSTPMAFASEGVATASGRYGVPGYETSRYLAHSRWFDASAQEPPDPTIVGFADSAHNSGRLTGVGRIWAPSAYRVPLTDINAGLRGKAASGETAWYPADFIVSWAAGGTVTIRDTTHHVTLPFRDHQGSGYGFFNITNVLATGITQAGFDVEFGLTGSGVFNIINYQHLLMVEPTCSDYWAVGAFNCAALSQTAELTPLDFNNDGVSDGTGIILVVNGEPFFMEMNALPAAGTQWHLRAVSGIMTADCAPALGPQMTDCSAYTFQPNPDAGTVVPGLRYRITVQQQFAVNASDSVDLERVHTVPDPYYGTSSLELSPNLKSLRFVNLPAQCMIRIYSVSGVLVDVLTHNDQTGGGEAAWDLRNRNNQFVASGVYFYHVEAPNGQQKVGRFTVVNFAQ